MTDFLLELRSEEIPARMQAKARDDLAKLFVAELDKAGLKAVFDAAGVDLTKPVITTPLRLTTVVGSNTQTR